MIIEETKLSGVFTMVPKVYMDARGSVMETYRKDIFHSEIGVSPNFVQENQSVSVKGVLRGLHTQHTNPQGKLVRVVDGSIFDVVVDIRKESPTFGQWVGIELSSTNHKQLWIPEGFAHGFVVLSESAICHYKLTDYYYPDNQITIAWNDSTINVGWPKDIIPILSDKDIHNSITLNDYVHTSFNQ
jgi:dTDP-4-dehydrorhamnose 3,5-epimerase